jgi:predicted  nucleic acid-binding Zn-ribbon protein
MWYGYTPEQHASVDEELADMGARLLAIAAEIQELAASMNKWGSTYYSALKDQKGVTMLRHMLQTEQRNQREGKEIQRRLWKG